MEDDLVELLPALLQRNLQILLPEEPGVRQPGGQHLGVAGDDARAAVARHDVGGADEVRGQRAGGVGQREIFLVGAHGELDHLARDGKEGGIEPAQQRHRPFGEAGIFGDEPLVGHDAEPLRGGGGGGPVADQLAAFGLIQNDVRGAQLERIIVRRTDRDRPMMVETVADGGGPRDDAGDLDRHHHLVEQRHDALQRPHPAQCGGAGRLCAPAHRFGPGKATDDRGHRVRQHRGGGAAGAFGDGIEDHVALGVGPFDQLIARQPGLAEEPGQRLCGRIGARALHLLRHRLGGERQAARDQREPARGGVGLDRGGGEAGPGQFGGEQPRQIGARLVLHPRGDFFGEQFEQEIGHFFSLSLSPWEREGPARACGWEGVQTVGKGIALTLPRRCRGPRPLPVGEGMRNDQASQP